MIRSDCHQFEQPLHDEIARLTQALRDIAGSEPIPTPIEAWQFCKDVATASLEQSGSGK